MSDFLIRMAGHIEGLDDQTIDSLEADLPRIQKIIVLARKIRPDVAEMIVEWEKVGPHIQRALTELGKG
jgi:hypothetical protein